MENRLETIKSNLPYGYEKKIAKEVGCSQGTVHNILNGKKSTRSSYKVKVMEAAIKLAECNIQTMQELAEKTECLVKASPNGSAS